MEWSRAEKLCVRHPPGYRPDNETGLYFTGARYYSPTLGRFLQTDPIGLRGGANRYAYVGNDPINLLDPSGECPWCIGAALGTVVGLAGQGISDLASGQLSSWQTYAGAGAGGAVGGAVLFTTANPWAAGAAASATQNLVTQGSNIATGQQQSFSVTSLAVQTTVGTVASGLLGTAADAGAFPGLTNSYTSLSNQMLTKFDNGTISDMLDTTAVKTFAGQADQWAPLTAAAPITDGPRPFRARIVRKWLHGCRASPNLSRSGQRLPRRDENPCQGRVLRT
jgi:RHS repeat-associated protein